MSFKYYFILSTVFMCLGFPSGAFGQYVQKESVNNVSFAIIYSEGLAGSAQWGVGINMMRNGATIRHQVAKGNGGNLSVNDKIPMRFIVAPTDLDALTWTAAGGVNDGGNNLNADFSSFADTGCRHYGDAGQPGAGRTWRVPTQRELQLIWMFRVPVGVIYPNAPMVNTATKNYWASTEKDAGNAWFFDFKEGAPHCSWQAKSTTAHVRCVSDY